MKWEEIEGKIKNEIKVGTKIPKTDGRTRTVTKIDGDKIHMRVGVETDARKYVTKDMIKFAFDKMSSGESFTSTKLKAKFPGEYSQGGCVFSMTGGILEYLDIASCVKNQVGQGFSYILNK